MAQKKKLKITKDAFKLTAKQFAIMTLGVLIYSFAWVAIIIPADGVGGGASGASLLIYYATGGAEGGIPVGISYFIINAILLVLAALILGAKFGVKTIYSIILVSVSMSFMQEWLPDNLFGLGSDKLLSAILGGAVAGFGIGLVLMQGGSTGGSDIVAMIINKYRNISYGRVVMATDFIIIACSYFVFKDISTMIYGYVLVAVFGFTADTLLAGNKQSAQLFIMSAKYEEIANMITNNLNRGVTVLDGTGWYTKKPTKVVMVVCRKYEANVIMQHIKALDQSAFITMGSVMGVYGQGFDTFRK